MLFMPGSIFPIPLITEQQVDTIVAAGVSDAEDYTDAALTDYSTTVQVNAAVISAQAIPVVPLKSTSFNLVGGTSIQIGTTALGYGSFALVRVRAVCLTIDTPGVDPIISIGTNAPDYNNMVAAFTLDELAAVGDYTQAVVDTGALVAENTAVFAKITTPSDATALTASIQVIGDYQGV